MNKISIIIFIIFVLLSPNNTSGQDKYSDYPTSSKKLAFSDNFSNNTNNWDEKSEEWRDNGGKEIAGRTNKKKIDSYGRYIMETNNKSGLSSYINLNIDYNKDFEVEIKVLFSYNTQWEKYTKSCSIGICNIDFNIPKSSVIADEYNKITIRKINGILYFFVNDKYWRHTQYNSCEELKLWLSVNQGTACKFDDLKIFYLDNFPTKIFLKEPNIIYGNYIIIENKLIVSLKINDLNGINSVSVNNTSAVLSKDENVFIASIPFSYGNNTMIVSVTDKKKEIIIEKYQFYIPELSKKIEKKVFAYQKSFDENKTKKAYKQWLYVYENQTPHYTKNLFDGANIIEKLIFSEKNNELAYYNMLIDIYFNISNISIEPLVQRNEFWSIVEKYPENIYLNRIKSKLIDSIGSLEQLISILKYLPQTYIDKNKIKIKKRAFDLVKCEYDALLFLKTYPNSTDNKNLFRKYSENVQYIENELNIINHLQESNIDTCYKSVLRILNTYNQIGTNSFENKFNNINEIKNDLKVTIDSTLACVFGDCIDNLSVSFDKKNNSLYIGKFSNKKPNGRGILYNLKIDNDIWVVDSKYEGDFNNGKQNGFGIQTWFNHEYGLDYYKGSWQDGKMNGKGKIFYKIKNNKDKYYRELSQTSLKYIKCYDGDFYNGYKHGEGIFIFENGNKMTVKYINDALLYGGERVFLETDGTYAKCNWDKDMQPIDKVSIFYPKGVGYMGADRYMGSAILEISSHSLQRHGDGVLFYPESHSREMTFASWKFDWPNFETQIHYYRNGSKSRKETMELWNDGIANLSKAFEQTNSNQNITSNKCYKIIKEKKWAGGKIDGTLSAIIYTIECDNGNILEIWYDMDRADKPYREGAILPIYYSSLEEAARANCGCY